MHDVAQTLGSTRGRRPEVSVRPVSPADGGRLRRRFSRLSGRSIYQRFHIPYPRVPEWAVALFADVNGDQGEALVALVGDEIVGHALYVRSDHGHDAEMAVLVEDGWQSGGSGGCSSGNSPGAPQAAALRPSAGKCSEKTSARSVCSPPCSPGQGTR